MTSSLLNARSLAKLTTEQRGERLLLIDPPVTPDEPTRPNRPLFIGAGIGGGLVFGIILALLVELILSPIRSASALARVTGAPPLGVIPVLSKKPSRRERRKQAAVVAQLSESDAA